MMITAEQCELDLHTNTAGGESLKFWLALNKTSNSESEHKANTYRTTSYIKSCPDTVF